MRLASFRKFGSIWSAAITFGLAAAVCSMGSSASALELKCIFYSAVPDNDWKDIQECETRKAQAVVSLMLLGVDRKDAIEVADEYRRKYSFDTSTGKPLSADPIAWSAALPDCFKRKSELRECVANFKYRPDNGTEIPEAQMKAMLENWSECRFWNDCPTVGGSYDPEAMSLEKANMRKYERVVNKARRAAMKKCKTIAVELAELTTPEKECSALR